MKKIVFLLYLFSYAQVTFADQSAFIFLEADLKSSFQRLTSDVRLYNYFGYSDLNVLTKIENRQSLASDLVTNRSSQFWNLENHTTKLSNVGPGLYLALDPYSSSPNAVFYSGANFGSLMLELTFSPGTNYFNITKPISLSRDTLNSLVAEKILSPTQVKTLLKDQKFTPDTLKFMVEPEYQNFRILVQNILKQNQISLIEYIWMSALQMLCDNRYIGSSMLYIGGSLPKEVTMVPFPLRNADFTTAEEEAMARNRKLINLLIGLKQLEKDYDGTSSSWRRNRIMNDVKDAISKQYGSQPDELQEIKTHSYKCLL